MDISIITASSREQRSSDLNQAPVTSLAFGLTALTLPEDVC